MVVSEKASMAMKKKLHRAHLLQTLLVFATTDDQFFCIADGRSSVGKVHVDDKVVICCNPQLAKLPPMSYFASMAIDGTGDQGDDDNASGMHPVASVVGDGGRRRT